MDAELIGRAQQGDEEAFASLAVAVGDRLHRVAHRILRDIDLAETHVSGQRDVLSIVDIDGARWVIASWHQPEASAEDLAELEGIIGSIRFDAQTPSASPSPGASPAA